MRAVNQFMSLLAVLLLPLGVCDASPSAFEVGGAVAHPGVWSVARLRQQWGGTERTLHFTLKGHPHTAHVLPLLSLIQAAHPRVNPQIKHHVLQFLVIVRGQDGYTADFSLSELMPDFGHEAAWLALDEDGRALSADDGPVELLVPGDVKAARWIHGIASVTVRDMAQSPPPGGP